MGATEEELIAIRVKLREAAKAVRDAHKVAAGIDEIGDEAEQTSRKADKAARSISRLNAANKTTRVNLGPFSTSLRGATLVIGGLVLAAEKLTPAALSAGEAVATLAGGAGAAGGVGLLALGQASTVAKLGLGGLTEALGGSEEAARSLSPEAYELFRLLEDGKQTLKETAEAAMLPGLDRGGRAAMRNFGVLNNLVHQTGTELGRLAGDAGGMLGSAEWGKDIRTLGSANVRIIGDLGDAGLHLADAARHILVEAAPLTEWLAANAEKGAAAAESWAEGARKGGELRAFFHDAQGDMRLFGQSADHVADAIGNLFSNQDVSGSGLLADLERATARFERWTDSPAVRRDFGAAIRTEVADGVAAAAGAAAETLPLAAGRAVQVFWESFWSASPEAKLLLGLVAGRKVWTGVRGQTPVTPLFVKDVALPGSGGGGGPGGVLGRAGKLTPLGAAGVWGLGAGALGLAGYESAVLLGKLFGDDRTPEQRGAAAAAQADRILGPPSRRPVLDEQGFKTGWEDTNPSTIDPRKWPGPFEPLIPVTVKIGEEVVARATGKATAKKNARKR